MSAARILIADDHPLTGEGLSLAARAALTGGQVVQVRSIAEAAAALEGRASYRLVLLDYLLPDARGFAGFLKLQHLAPQVPIVIVTAREDERLVEAAQALGAAGFIPKSRPLDAVAAILREILAGRTWFPRALTPSGAVDATRRRIGELSPAQYTVLLELADGRSNKQIAHDLSVTEATVKAHLTAVYRKLGVTNRAQALLAIRALLEPTAAAPS
jgi:DNA-binding NarL/FixJ family response regulator